MSADSDDYKVVTHRSRQKIDGEWREGLLQETNYSATTDETMAKALEHLTAPLRTKIERHLDELEAEAIEVAQVNGLSSTLEPPTKEHEAGIGIKGLYAHVGQTAEPCTRLCFAYKMESQAAMSRSLLKQLDGDGLSEDVMWKVEALFLSACAMIDGRRLLHISELERPAMSGARMLEQRSGTPPEKQRQAVTDYHNLKAENPGKGETWLKLTIGKKYGVHRSRVHDWIKDHS